MRTCPLCTEKERKDGAMPKAILRSDAGSGTGQKRIAAEVKRSSCKFGKYKVK